MKKTGELLKQKRESAGLSVSEVALATKINPKVLIALESGDEAHLPAKTFLKGFVRSYAVFLKCDLDEVMNLYQEEAGGSSAASRSHLSSEPSKSTDGSSSFGRVDEESSAGIRTTAVIGIIILIGLIIGVRELIEKYQREKIVTNEVKVTPLVTPPVIPQPAPQPQGATPVATTQSPPTDASTAQASPVPAPAAAAPAAQPAPPPPPPVEPPKPVSKPEPPPAPATQPPPAPVAQKPDSETPPAPAPLPAKPKAAKVQIILEALDKVDVKFKMHGEAKTLSLKPTEVHTIHSDEPIVLDVSDGGALNLIINGRDRGTVGELGKSAQVKVP